MFVALFFLVSPKACALRRTLDSIDVSRARPLAAAPVGFRVIPANLEHFGNESGSWAPLHLDDDVERIRDIGLNGAIGHSSLYRSAAHNL